MVSPKKMRNDKLKTKQFFIYHFYDFIFFTDLANILLRDLARSGGYSIRLFSYIDKFPEKISKITISKL